MNELSNYRKLSQKILELQGRQLEALKEQAHLIKDHVIETSEFEKLQKELDEIKKAIYDLQAEIYSLGPPE